MSKVIFISNNGIEKVLRDDMNLIEGDVMFRDDYIAAKLFTREDIEARLEDLGYGFTEDDVNDVIKAGGNWSGLKDCTYEDRMCIDSEIKKVMQEKSEQVKRIAVRDISWGGLEEEIELPRDVVITADELTHDERKRLFNLSARDEIITLKLKDRYSYEPDDFNSALY